ncbi:MAG: tetratricopeptide repeat protein [Verrucomicrobiota bacterium]
MMESKQHMLDGIAHLNQGEWESALHHFERAAELRESQPWRHDPEAAWVLAAAWINRSDVLRILGQTPEAIHSLDRAIDAMNHVPLADHPDRADRLILAWINRATACGEAQLPDAALEDFSKAEELLRTKMEAPSGRRQLLASMLHANRARILLDLDRTIEGWRDSQSALDCLADIEPAESIAEAAIKARGIHCRALAMLLDEPDGLSLETSWIARATDAVEEALLLVKSSHYRSDWITDLVKYGAKIYRVCQPHFLAEFIRDWTRPFATDSDASLVQSLTHELLLAKADLERRIRQRPHDTPFVEKELRTLASLQRAETELARNFPSSGRAFASADRISPKTVELQTH